MSCSGCGAPAGGFQHCSICVRERIGEIVGHRVLRADAFVRDLRDLTVLLAADGQCGAFIAVLRMSSRLNSFFWGGCGFTFGAAWASPLAPVPSAAAGRRLHGKLGRRRGVDVLGLDLGLRPDRRRDVRLLRDGHEIDGHDRWRFLRDVEAMLPGEQRDDDDGQMQRDRADQPDGRTLSNPRPRRARFYSSSCFGLATSVTSPIWVKPAALIIPITSMTRP